jgi:hypothetical protein
MLITTVDQTFSGCVFVGYRCDVSEVGRGSTPVQGNGRGTGPCYYVFSSKTTPHIHLIFEPEYVMSLCVQHYRR